VKILITGATGQLGNKVGFAFHKMGYEVIVISRSKKSIEKLIFPASVIYKNLVTEALAAEDFFGVNSVIHLMGEPIDGRWTKSKKIKILNSRIQSSKNLLKNMPTTVQTVISASAQGYYGDSGSIEVSEASLKGSGFLSDVCNDWEAPFRNLKQRAVQLRIGIILDPHSGALKKMISIFQKNLGAALGSGHQWISWISMEDMVSVIVHIQKNSLSGPLNCSTPNPVMNLSLTEQLCQSLGVVKLPNVPKFMLKFLFGETSSIFLSSTKMNCQKLLNSGFNFKYADLKIYFKSVIAEKIK